MIGFHSLARFGLVLAILLGLVSGVVKPQAAQADTDLAIGGVATVAYANGDEVRLRSYPGADAPVIRSVAEGTIVGVVDGPASADDGSLWYQVSIDGEIGFIVETFLANASVPNDDPAVTEEPVTEEPATEEVVAEPTESVTLPDGIPGIIAGTNGAGARCRVTASADGAVLTVVPEGSGLPVVGEAIDGWLPVVCDSQLGYISADFIAMNGNPAPAEVVVTEEPTEVVTEEATEEITEEATEEPAEVVTEEATEAVTEEATEETTEEATEEPTDEVTEEATAEPTDEVTEEATVEPTDEATEEVTAEPTEEPTDEATPTATSTETATSTPESTPTATETQVAEEASPAPTALGTPVLSGTGIVFGTNGGGLRCRTDPSSKTSVVAVLAEGSVVQIRGEVADGWLPVICDEIEGYVNADYVLLDRLGATGDGTSADVSAAVGSATVKGTNGDGLRCRSKASASGSVIVVLSEGTTVKLRSGSSGEWQAVTCAGQKGFASNVYLSFDGKTSAAIVTAAANNTGTAIVTGTNGDGVRCRAKGSYSAAILMTIPEGKTVTLRGVATKAGFQPIYCGGVAGYVVADFLSYVTKTGSATSAATTTSSTAKVTGTGGTGVRLRANASSSGSIITVVPEGATVTLRSGSSGDWTAVSYNGSNGFIFKSYLTASTKTTTSGGTATTTNTVVLKKGNRAKTVASVNLRYSASMNGGIAAVAPKGTVVLVTGSIMNGFYPVDWDGLAGYMHSDYIAKTQLALTTRGGSSSGGGTTSGGTTGSGTTTGGGGGTATGNSSIVNYAMQYLGYPYVWATHGPSSFDCSGFTYWVVKNVLGRDIGAGLWTQAAAGTTVSQGDLQPGDLVFFQNTYTWGLSHVGIYVGNGQFIHAQNESTGVVISSLSSTYYSTRWYGAVRLT